MPNWCENQLEIHGPKEDLIKFREAAKSAGHDLTLGALFPMPKELKNTEASFNKSENFTLKKKYGYDNWYDWASNNWGTKWDVEGMLVDDTTDYVADEYLLYEFQSAWAPPETWLKKIAKKKLWKNLKFELHYFEPGMMFAGELFINGKSHSAASRNATAGDCQQWGYDEFAPEEEKEK